MYHQEQKQKERLKEFVPHILSYDLSKYGFVFDHGPVTTWQGDLSGNINTYTWKQKGGSLLFKITVMAKLHEEGPRVDSDSLAASISDTARGNQFMLLNSFEEDRKHPIKGVTHNFSNKSIEEFSRNYLKVLSEALDTYLNDFIMGRKFEPTTIDRGDY